MGRNSSGIELLIRGSTRKAAGWDRDLPNVFTVFTAADHVKLESRRQRWGNEGAFAHMVRDTSTHWWKTLKAERHKIARERNATARKLLKGTVTKIETIEPLQ